ncbi:MAG TPA: hypothetical protein DEF45_04735 [Rhodopirellula sp.]|nr:hypothetical protein [Rhodopirellula sp.]
MFVEAGVCLGKSIHLNATAGLFSRFILLLGTMLPNSRTISWQRGTSLPMATETYRTIKPRILAYANNIAAEAS